MLGHCVFVTLKVSFFSNFEYLEPKKKEIKKNSAGYNFHFAAAL